MSVRFSVHLIPFAVGLAAAPALAQVTTLSSEAAVAEALAGNVGLRAEREATAVAFERPAQERFLMPPMFEAQIWQWPLTTVNPAEVDMYMFTFEQAYPGRGKRAAREALAQREAEEGQAGVPVAERELVQQVRLAWSDLAAARRVRATYEGTLAALTDLGEASTARYAAATGGQQDVLRNIVEIAGIRRELIRVDERARVAEVRLATLLGRSPGSRIELLAERGAPQAALDADQLVAAAVAARPEVAAIAAERKRIEATLGVIAVDRRPDWVVGGGYMLTPGGAGAWTARAGLTWPRAPWSKGRFEAQAGEQEAALRASDARMAELRQDIGAAVHEAVVSLDAARARLGLVRDAIKPQALQALEVARIGYQAGRVAFIDVIDTFRTALAVDTEIVDAEADVWRAEAALERALGEPLAGVLRLAPAAGQEQ